MSHQISKLSFGRIAATLAVTDMDRAFAFYRDVLGFEVVFQNGDPVGFAILKKDAAELHITLVKDHRPASFNVAHMLVGDADGLYACIEAAGCRILKGLKTQEYGLKTFVFADPFGNRIDVGAPLRTDGT
ncbi:glyoxalase superfamily protein [uncultured Roseibium sp.]|uniref:VOC family protein n=1 Tax=uncultured Roseibium sp. TaxID=1936171 RepID=UPI00321688D3